MESLSEKKDRHGPSVGVPKGVVNGVWGPLVGSKGVTLFLRQRQGALRRGQRRDGRFCVIKALLITRDALRPSLGGLYLGCGSDGVAISEEPAISEADGL